MRLEISAVKRAVDAARVSRLKVPTGSLPLELSRDVPGLQVADVLVHALGPGGAQKLPVEAPSAHTLVGLRARFQTSFCHSLEKPLEAAHPTVSSGATEETHGRVIAACQKDAATHVVALRRLCKELPPNTLLYGVEGALETVLAIEGSGA